MSDDIRNVLVSSPASQDLNYTFLEIPKAMRRGQGCLLPDESCRARVPIHFVGAVGRCIAKDDLGRVWPLRGVLNGDAPVRTANVAT